MVETRQIIYKSYSKDFKDRDFSYFLLQTLNRDGTKFFGVKMQCTKDGDGNQFYCEETGWQKFITICRYDFALDKSEYFDSFDILGPQPYTKDRVTMVDMYCIADDYVVVVLWNDFCLIQHLVQLIPPGSVARYLFDQRITRKNYRTAEPPEPVKLPKLICAQRGHAITVCSRRMTLESVHAIHIGWSLLEAGQVVVNGSSEPYSSQKCRALTELVLIAANPLSIDRYPDEILSPHIAKVVHTISADFSLAFKSPMFYKDTVYFWLLMDAEKKGHDHSATQTTTFRTLKKSEEKNNEYIAGIASFDNTEHKHSIGESLPYVVCSTGDLFYLCYVEESGFHFNRRQRVDYSYTKWKFEMGLKVNACFKYFNCEEPFLSCGCCLRRPEVHFVYTIDFSQREFRWIPYDFEKVGPANGCPMYAALPIGELMILRLPYDRKPQLTASFLHEPIRDQQAEKKNVRGSGKDTNE